MRNRKILFTSAALPAAVLLAATAFAQTRPTPATPDKPASQAPSTSQSPSTMPSSPPTGSAAGTGAGTGTSTASPGQAGYNAASQAVRTARFEARIATIKAGLMLNDEQQRLWPAVESAIRDAYRQHQDWHDRMRSQNMPSDFVERLQRRGEMMSAHGAAMTRLAEAIKPLHATLSEDQKRRVASLMRRGMEDERGRMMGGHMGGYDRWGMDSDRRWRDRDNRYGYGRGGMGGMYGHHRWHDEDRYRGEYGRGRDRDYGRGSYDWFNRYDPDRRRGSRWDEDDGRYRRGMDNNDYGRGGYGQRGQGGNSGLFDDDDEDAEN